MLSAVGDGETWDIIVIGGGATGLGTAIDAGTRGYRTLLIEAADFAQATSSRSTKLIHGGVRYLAQGGIGLVYEALHERALLLRNAPHIVHPRSFLVPAESWPGWIKYGAGLKAYDLLAGRGGLGGSRWVGRDEALRLAPTLRPDRLRGGVVFEDGQFDDARMSIALLRTFLDLGGMALNYFAVTALIKEAGRVAGVVARDEETRAEFRIKASAVVNATGVFADAVRHLDDQQAPPLIRPSQGSHIVLDQSFLPGETAVLVPRTDDGRVMFAIPWLGRVLVGTTDRPVDRPTREPRPSPDEFAFLQSHVARYLSRTPEPNDIRSAFAGLRPLLGRDARESTARLSREHAVITSPSGLITITGGKWTTYRRMGRDAVDRAVAVAGLPARASRTEMLRIHGATDEPNDGPLARYGSDAGAVARVLGERPGWSEPLHPDLPYRAGEAAWAARYEMVRTVEDVLARRMRALLLDARASLEIAPRVAAILASELGFDEAWQREQVERYRELSAGYLPG
jgi:glycerol-3-phosphate dehydrogenase